MAGQRTDKSLMGRASKGGHGSRVTGAPPASWIISSCGSRPLIPGGGGMVEAVVFDVDGVLIDSEPVWERVRRKFVADHGGRWPQDGQGPVVGMLTAGGARD